MDNKLSFNKSLLVLLFLLLSIFVGVIMWEQDPQIPIVISTIFAIVLSLFNGTSWDELEESIVKTINSITPSIVFLLAMGIMLGTWLHSGVVPTIIYYGSRLISPNIFLPTAFYCVP